MIRTVAPMGRRTRVSPDSAWPLRRADGTKFYEAPAAAPDAKARASSLTPSPASSVPAQGTGEHS